MLRPNSSRNQRAKALCVEKPSSSATAGKERDRSSIRRTTNSARWASTISEPALCLSWVKNGPEGTEIRLPLSPQKRTLLASRIQLEARLRPFPCHGLDCTRQPRLATRRSRPRTRPGGSRTPAIARYSAFAEWRLWLNRHFALATEVQGVLGVSCLHDRARCRPRRAATK
jgi:hypothetical protein